MKILYAFYNDWTAQQVKELRAYGISINTGYDRLDVLEEKDTIPLLDVLNKWGIESFVGTTYDKQDLNNASLLVYDGVWQNGYPMPDNDAGYKNITYNLDDYCEACGIGKVQKAPFRLKSEPRWGNKSMFDLNWIFDETFVRRDVYEELFKPKGLACSEVLLHKKETIIGNTVQLIIPKVKVPLALKNQPFEICGECGRKKYSPQIKGFFPSFEKEVPDLQMFKCSEYFGSGADAHNKIFITNDLWKEMQVRKIKPAVFAVDSTT